MAGAEFGAFKVKIVPPRLGLFVPVVMREPGPTQLIWEMEVKCDDIPDANVRVLMDAHTGEIARRYPLMFEAINRQVSDANSTASDPGTLVRSEGGAASNVADANSAYGFLGDTYSFYLNRHGRDAIDGQGGALNATCRYCQQVNPLPAPPTCPPPGLAFYSNGRIYYGTGFAADDITAHELTHGVTGNEGV